MHIKHLKDSIWQPTIAVIGVKRQTLAQVPMVPLTDIIRRLVMKLFGLHMADAAAVFGTPEAIQNMCTSAGFGDPVQVISWGYCITIVACKTRRMAM